MKRFKFVICEVARLLLFVPCILFFVYFVTQNYIESRIWGIFFQNKLSVDTWFHLAICISMIFLLFIIFLVIKIIQLFFLKGKKFKVCIIEIILIILLPTFGMLINKYFMEKEMILKSLKLSFVKEDVDIQKVVAWLNSLDVKSIKHNKRLDYDDLYFPDDIRNIISSLKPNIVLIKVSPDNRPYADLHFENPILDIGVVIGVEPEMFSTNQEIKTIVVDDNTFIWMEVP